MKVIKLKMVLAGVMVVILTGCSFISDRNLDVNDGQAGGVESSINLDVQKSESAVNTHDDAGDSVKSRISSPDEQFQAAENNQAAGDRPDGLVENTIYFLSDSTDIEPDLMPLIEKQTQELLENFDYALILEGHADERGSREYNIGLGEERAKAVAKIMQARGVRNTQLEIVSYGEEKPASPKHSETAWHLNCRVNLNLQRTQK